MNTITINSNNRTIEMTKKYAAAASRYGTAEYRALQEARRDYPDFKVITKTVSKSSKNTFSGLTYDYMEQYIKAHDESGKRMAEFKDLRGLSEEAKAMCSKPHSYLEVKRWFLKTYPEFETFHKQCEKLVAEKTA